MKVMGEADAEGKRPARLVPNDAETILRNASELLTLEKLDDGLPRNERGVLIPQQ
jgi:hypothetical protein